MVEREANQKADLKVRGVKTTCFQKARELGAC